MMSMLANLHAKFGEDGRRDYIVEGDKGGDTNWIRIKDGEGQEVVLFFTDAKGANRFADSVRKELDEVFRVKEGNLCECCEKYQDEVK